MLLGYTTEIRLQIVNYGVDILRVHVALHLRPRTDFLTS